MSASSPIVGVLFLGGLEGYPVALGVLLGEGQVIVRKVSTVRLNQPIDKGVEREVPQAELRTPVVTPYAVALNE
jgi:hypothetical protein